MAMTERSRAALYEGLTGFIDPEAVGEMLSHFPARDVEEPATTELVRAEGALLRADFQQQMGGLRTDVQQQMGGLRTDVQQQMGELRTDLQQQMSDLRTDLQQQMGELRTDLQQQMGELRTDLQQQMSDLRVELLQAMTDHRAEVGRDLADHRAVVDRKLDAFAAELRTEIRSSMRWTIGVMVSFSGILVTAVSAVAAFS